MSFLLQLNIIHTFVALGIDIIIFAMLIRAIASWFGMDERFAFIRFLARITDPFIMPFRRIIKPMGMLDLSYFVAWFMLVTLQILITQALPGGW
jgi:YggT family protein